MDEKKKKEQIRRLKSDKQNFLWEMPRIIKREKIELNAGIQCISENEKECPSPKKCNRKNSCNEELKEYFPTKKG